MKNIHVLSTDKPSRLVKNLQYNTFWLRTDYIDREIQRGVEELQYQNIYITSSDEEIKEGDYMINMFNDVYYVHKEWVLTLKDFKTEEYKKKWKKIILTTDADLIKDGVQAIDDEFLEWFVNNPSCEEVKVEEILYRSNSKDRYEIIIPKEEPKQSIKDKILSETPESVIQKVRETTNELIEPKQRPEKYSERFDNKENEIVQGVFNPENWGRRLVEDKQETFEEAAEKSAIEQMEAGNSAYILGFIECAKWQAERMYSEEEVLDILLKFDNFKEVHHAKGKSILDYETRMKWFEQFKKK